MKKKIIVFISILVVILSILLINSCSKKEDIKVTLLENNKVIDNGSYADEYVIINIEAKKVYKKIILVDKNTKEVKEYTPKLVNGKYVLEVKVEESSNFDLYTIDEDGNKSNSQEVNIKIDRKAPTFEMNENKEVYTLNNCKDKKDIVINVNDIKDDSKYKVYYKVNDLGYKEVEATDKCDINLSLKSGFNNISVKVVDESGKETVKTKIIEVNYTLEIVDEKNNKMSLFKVINGESINYYDNLPSNNDSLFKGYSVNKVDLIDNDFKVSNLEKIYVIYDKQSKLSVDKPTCNNSSYTGNSINLVNGNNSAYSISNNYQTLPGTYKITISLNDGYIWNTADSDNKSDLVLNCSISKRNITVTTESKSKIYDGLELTGNAIVTSGSIGNNRFVYSSDSTITNAGSIKNEGTISIINGKDEDVTKYYSIKYNYGTLTVDKADQVCTISNVSDATYGNNPNGTFEASCTGPNTIHYSSSDEEIITVGEETYSIISSIGNADIEVYQEGSDNYNKSITVKHRIVVSSEKYTVTYSYNNEYYTGVNIVDSTKEFIYGDNALSNISNPTLDGWTFKGWSTSKDSTYVVDSYTVKGDITLYAVFKKAINLNYLMLNNSYTDTKTIDHGLTATFNLIDTPSIVDDYSFYGWTSDDSYTNVISNDKFTINEDLTLSAIYSKDIELTYDTNGGNSIEKDSGTVYRKYDGIKKVDFELKVPTKTNYHFVSWCTDSTLNNEINSISTDSSLTLYAKWVENITVVKFNTGITESVTNMEIKSGSHYSDLPILENGTKGFNGWYLGDTLITTNSVIPDTESITLTAHYSTSGTPQVLQTDDTMYFVYGINIDKDLYKIDDKDIINTWIIPNIDIAGNDRWNVAYLTIENLKINKSFINYKPTTMFNWFGYRDENNTSKYSVLKNISGLENIDTSQVTIMSRLFYRSIYLTDIDLSMWNTSNLKNAYSLFFECYGLKNVNLSNWDTSNVTYMESFFRSCNLLESIDLTNFDVSKVTVFRYFFWGCTSLREVDLSTWVPSSATSFDSMFSGCTSLENIYSNIDWADYFIGTESANMFYNCTSLKNFNSGNLDVNYANPVTGYFTPITMLNLYNEYTSIDPTNSIIANVTNIEFTSSILDDSYTYLRNFDSKNNGTIKLYKKNTNLYVWSSNMIYFPLDSSSMFSKLNDLKSIVFNDCINTSLVTDMRMMFRYCHNLESVDVSGFDTSLVISMYAMFDECKKITSIDVTHFDTKNVKTMYAMFSDCNELINLDVSNFDTSNVQNMGYMFNNCHKLSVIDVSGFDTHLVTTMYSMFNECYEVAVLNVSHFVTSKVTSMRNMFNQCKKIEYIDVSGFDTNIVTSIRCMFAECINLVTLDLSSFDTSNIDDLYRLFCYDTKLKTIYVSNKWDVSGVAAVESKIADIFLGCSNLVGGNGTTYSASHTNKDYAIIDGANPGYLTLKVNQILNFSKSITKETTSIFDGIENIIFESGTTYTNDYYDLSVNQDRSIKMYFINEDCIITSNGVIEFPVDSSMFFSELRNIKSIDFGEGVIDTSKVVSMGNMFYECRGITSLDLSEFNTSNVAQMYGMFSYMISITDYDLSSFDTRNVINMFKMFYDNKSLVNLDISNFITPNLQNMQDMFAWSTALKSVEMDNIDTSNVTNMQWIFSACRVIEVIDISNFDTAKVTNMHGMFSQCYELNTIYVGEKFTTVSVSHEGDNDKELFLDCSKLVGRNGTTYNADHIGIDYARIDDSGTPGYFSVKTLKNLYTSYIENSSDLKDTLVNATSLTFTDSILDDSYTFMANVDSRNIGLIKLYSKNNELFIYSKSEIYLPNDSSQMFRDLNSVKTINFNNLLNSCYSTTFYWLFCRDFELQSIDLSGFDTSRINHISAMFEQCKKLVSVDLSNLNTSRVRDFSYLFSTCLKLTSVDLSGFDFSSATSFYRMFALCEKLTTIYCNSDFKKLINISTFSPVGGDDIFKDCYLLPGYVSGNTNIDYANPDTGYFTPNYMKNLNNVFTSDEKSSITSVTFTNNVLDNNYTFVSDIDQLNSGSIKLYRKNNDIYITSSDKIYFPPESSRMFENFTNVVNYNFDNISTIRVINFGLMFSKNKKITSLDVSKFDTRNATNMIYMFDAMSLLSSLDISNFDTSNVTNFGHMFSYDVSLETLNLGNMNTSSAEIMSQMFYDLRKLVTLDISSFDVSKVTNFKEMFVHCISLTTIYCDSDWSSRSSSLVTDGDLDMFKECSLLSNYSESNVNINYANANTGYFTGRTMKNLYNSYTSDTNSILYDTLVNATSIEFTSSVLDGSYTFKDNLDSKNKGSIKLYSKGTNLYIYTSGKVYFPENSIHLFENLSSVKSINFNNLVDTSRVNTMYSLFYNCSSLESLDLRCFDTSHVELMSWMFYGCSSLTSVDLSNFNTSNTTYMKYMFYGCKNLTNLDLSSFNTSKLVNMRSMFTNCTNLVTIDLSSFDTSKVDNVFSLFRYDKNLTTIYVSNKFDISGVTGVDTDGYLKDAEIFSSCTKLVGGNGTTYSVDHVGKDYAVVDMAYYDETGSIVSGTPGYLTLRNVISSEYERVSYIETSKTQYITTDITIGDIKDKYTMDIEFEALSLYDYNTLWGSTLNEDTYEGWIYGSGGPRSRSNDLYIDKRNVDIKLSLNTKHRYSTFVESNTTSFSLLDKNLNYSDVFDSRGNSIASLSKNILLFKSGTDYSHLKVYSFRIISNGVIIGDFVPVKRKSDGIYGMYDTVRNKFYKSEGTSEFIGPSE